MAADAIAGASSTPNTQYPDLTQQLIVASQSSSQSLQNAQMAPSGRNPKPKTPGRKAKKPPQKLAEELGTAMSPVVVNESDEGADPYDSLLHFSPTPRIPASLKSVQIPDSPYLPNLVSSAGPANRRLFSTSNGRVSPSLLRKKRTVTLSDDEEDAKEDRSPVTPASRPKRSSMTNAGGLSSVRRSRTSDDGASARPQNSTSNKLQPSRSGREDRAVEADNHPVLPKDLLASVKAKRSLRNKQVKQVNGNAGPLAPPSGKVQHTTPRVDETEGKFARELDEYLASHNGAEGSLPEDSGLSASTREPKHQLGREKAKSPDQVPEPELLARDLELHASTGAPAQQLGLEVADANNGQQMFIDSVPNAEEVPAKKTKKAKKRKSGPLAEAEVGPDVGLEHNLPSHENSPQEILAEATNPFVLDEADEAEEEAAIQASDRKKRKKREKPRRKKDRKRVELMAYLQVPDSQVSPQPDEPSPTVEEQIVLDSQNTQTLAEVDEDAPVRRKSRKRKNKSIVAEDDQSQSHVQEEERPAPNKRRRSRRSKHAEPDDTVQLSTSGEADIIAHEESDADEAGVRVPQELSGHEDLEEADVQTGPIADDPMEVDAADSENVEPEDVEGAEPEDLQPVNTEPESRESEAGFEPEIAESVVPDTEEPDLPHETDEDRAPPSEEADPEAKTVKRASSKKKKKHRRSRAKAAEHTEETENAENTEDLGEGMDDLPKRRSTIKLSSAANPANHHYMGPRTGAELEMMKEHRLNQPLDLRETGTFSEDEAELLRRYIKDYMHNHDLDLDSMVQLIQWTKPYRKSEDPDEDPEELARKFAYSTQFWKDLHDVLPMRKARSGGSTYIARFVRRKWHQYKGQGGWDAEEDETLKRLAERYPNEWKKIAQIMGDRSDLACRDRWRNYLQYGDRRTEGPWEDDEINRLLRAVSESHALVNQERVKAGQPPLNEVNSGLISWQVVSDKVGTRTRHQCMTRYATLVKLGAVESATQWREALSASFVAGGKKKNRLYHDDAQHKKDPERPKLKDMRWGDKLELILALSQCDFDAHEDIDWNQVLDRMEGDVRWRKKHLKAAFRQLCEIVLERTGKDMDLTETLGAITEYVAEEHADELEDRYAPPVEMPDAEGETDVDDTTLSKSGSKGKRKRASSSAAADSRSKKYKSSALITESDDEL